MAVANKQIDEILDVVEKFLGPVNRNERRLRLLDLMDQLADTKAFVANESFRETITRLRERAVVRA